MPLELPIFELPLALVPGEHVPLHIFEERYKLMIDNCVKSGEPFGILFRDEEGARSTGCSAGVTEVLERFEDGRVNIVVTGIEPFRVLDRFDDPEDPKAEIEMMPVQSPGTDDELAERARESFLELAAKASGQRPPADEIAELDAFGLAARVEMPAEAKQQILEADDEDERMRLIDAVLISLTKTLEQASSVAERAKSNGKIRVG